MDDIGIGLSGLGLLFVLIALRVPIGVALIGVSFGGLYVLLGWRVAWGALAVMPYQFSANWFKPIMNFENGSFLAYQGYVDYQFGMDSDYVTSTDGGATFQGLYWHSKRYALGYGLKIFKDVYGIDDTPGFKSSGFSHYISATYKF